ncbi:DoxX family protein [Paenibacillus montanisoli]|uniref:Oxidoreductase n=1 Tax=Paenibacillus montanisoli TaxID=2081970 RepID=A0A328U2X1_9BACL|nr:DoxX family protein [Paenibacillus montanisoli]RAP76989.1 oxidoreductase [Paenibacillus montanisoli]
MLDFGLLLIRLVIGVTLMGHGAQKLFGWFGGYGPKGTGGWMESVGIKPGVLMAVLAGLAEMGGGLLFAAGYLTAVGATLIVLTMLGAIIKVHLSDGYWVDKGGFEYPFMLTATAIAIALIGPGAYAIG